jgi:hypothetical protein
MMSSGMVVKITPRVCSPARRWRSNGQLLGAAHDTEHAA